LFNTKNNVDFTQFLLRLELTIGAKMNKKQLVAKISSTLGQSKAEKIDDNDCSEGSVIGGILGAGIALSSSRGKDRFWAVPAGGTAGALIGCQVDGG